MILASPLFPPRTAVVSAVRSLRAKSSADGSVKMESSSPSTTAMDSFAQSSAKRSRSLRLSLLRRGTSRAAPPPPPFGCRP